ncbi:hypothetical protein Tco_1081452 [Tanacetum coccineum]|uniref:Reverse transcriptase domain-containing protein n=1 Tax=Tanacetum coccineum TaxID=301880 RepID=A0ABQ5HZ90_9ASTR
MLDREKCKCMLGCWLLDCLIDDFEEYGKEKSEMVKIGRAHRLKHQNISKITPPILPTPLRNDEGTSPQLPPITNPPLTPQENEKSIEAINKKFHELQTERIIEKGLPNKLEDPSNFVLPLKLLGLSRANPSNADLKKADNSTCDVIIDNGRGTTVIDDGAVKHVFYAKLKRSLLDFNKKFYNSLGRAPNRCSSSIGKTLGVVIVHLRNRLGRLDHGLTEL